MATHKGINIIKKQGGLGRRNPNTDSVFGLVLGGVVATGLALGAVAKIEQVADAEALGIDASYDANNEILVYHHITEVFRLAPDATLFIMLVAQGTSMTDICDEANDHLKGLILSPEANREIKYTGVVLNPILAYVPVLSGGLDADVLSAIPKAQELLDTLREDSIFIDGVMLEGREFNGTVTASTDLRTLDSENISVIIAQEPTTASLDAIYAKTAAVGSALGMIGIRKVSENMGSVDILNKPDANKGEKNYPLTDVADSLWITANLSSGSALSTYTNADVEALKEKGYIVAAGFEGYPYIYFNTSSTTTEIADDFNYIEKNRVWNKAARLTITALTPKINSKVKIDPATGSILPVTIKNWEAVTSAEVGKLLDDDDVSAVNVTIDPAQNVLGGNPIIVQVEVTPDGIADSITAEIGFVNPF